MNSIDVLSMGPGDLALTAPMALQLLKEAETVYCADRFAFLVPEQKRRPFLPLSTALDDMAKEASAGKKLAVLVSGDAGFYSLLALLKKRFGGEKLNVIPGISSVSAFCAKLAVGWQDAKIISAHGRPLKSAALCHEARTHSKTVLLLDAENDPNRVRELLDQGDLKDVKLTVGENLSYEDERIGPYEPRQYADLSILLIENPCPEGGLPPVGMSDDLFLRAKVPMTKREIRIQILSELRLTPDATVWDVGAGTGSVSVECARQCPYGTVYAIEREEDALSLIRQNAARFHAENIVPGPGEAPGALAGLPAPTHVFLGGTGGKTQEIVKLLEDFKTDIRLCATAVTLETEEELMRILGGLEDFQAAQIAVSRIEKLGNYHMRRANNPVTVFTANIKRR